MRIQLRKYQIDCLKAIEERFKNGDRKVSCILPTGSGKTTIFGAYIKKFSMLNPDKTVVMVSHLGLLITQTGDRFNNEWGIDTGILQGNNFPSREKKCVLTTMQSFCKEDKVNLWSKLGRNFFSGSADNLNVGLIIVDECHRMGSTSYQSILDQFPESKVIGFTATPFRENKLMLNLFDSMAYTISMEQLILDGYLVPPKLNLTPFNPLDMADMFKKIYTIYMERHKGQKAVVYLKTIEDAKLCRNILEDLGVKSSAITSEVTGEQRDTLLKNFREGNGPDILTTVDVLTAGFDSPNLCAIFMPYKIGSVTTYLQRVGRGLRPYTNKLHCDIYVGADCPNMEKGYWEKINNQMLHYGKKPEEYDNMEDMVDYAELDMSKEQYEWTADVVRMARECRDKGMQNLFDMIIHKEFPAKMLNYWLEHSPAIKNKRSKVVATTGQVGYLKAFGIYREGVTKQEASNMIYAHKRSTGWTPPADEIVPNGKHQGKHFSEVPPMYWNILAKKARQSEVYQAYIVYRNKTRRK